jgi:23S rRNA pseudouridine1911/1915/1917 synthase
MMIEQYQFIIDETQQGKRLDHVLAALLVHLSRSRLKKLIEEQQIHVNAQLVAPSTKLKLNDVVTVLIPESREADPLPQQVEFEVIYEDDDVIVINKPAGLVVHPGAGNPDLTLVNGLLAHCGDSLSGIGGVKRPGIVHRLDKGTSGLMVVAKHDQAHQYLSNQFADRTLKRTYRAICWGMPKTFEGTITGNIGRDPRHRQRMKVIEHGGKEAITHYEVLERLGNYASLVSCQLETGRTHQIRVHLATIGHSLIGDPLYGKRPRGLAPTIKDTLHALTQAGERPALHAEKLRFIHPRTEKLMKFSCDLPDDFITIQEYLTDV